MGRSLTDLDVQKTEKHGGGNIMEWGCMTWGGIGYASRIENGLDSMLDREILGDELIQTIEYYSMNKNNIVFQHDNDPKHTANETKRWIDQNGLNVLPWPSQSPDLNPIEHLWDEVGRRLRKLTVLPTSPNDLWEQFETVWNEIPVDVCQKLISTMPERISNVIKAKGGYTRW